MIDKDIKESEHQLLNSDYSVMTFSTNLFDLFGKRDEDIAEYIKPGREFWHYDGGKWRKLKVTYVRSGVMFFKFDDEQDKERAWFIGSFNVHTMCVAQVYPYEISAILSKTYPDNDFVEFCKSCKWEDYNGKIKVEVIWNN